MQARRNGMPRRSASRIAVSLAMSGVLMTVGMPLYAGCPADFTGDGDVGAKDLAVLLGAWGGPQADLNGDGLTDGADLAVLLGAWGPCSTTCTEHVPMDFQSEVVSVVAGSTSFAVTLDGSVAVGPTGATSGIVNATLPNGDVVLLDFNLPTGPVLAFPGGTIQIDPGIPIGLVVVEGVLTPVPAVLDQFYIEASNGVPLDQWAPASRATLALAAIASTPSWQCNVEAALALAGTEGGVAEASFGCKLAAYGAATLIAGLAAAGCAALTGGCAVGTAVTIGGMSVPCVVLIGLCGAAGFAGTAAAYEAVLALWGD